MLLSSSVPLGLALLTAGFAVYGLARPLAALVEFPDAAWLGCAPTFCHTAAFSLLTAAAADFSKRYAAAVCGTWMVINVLFELGQHPAISARLVALLPAWFEHVAVLDRIGPYFTRGRFDPLDLAAGAVGAGFAWLVLWKRVASGGTDARGTRP